MTRRRRTQLTGAQLRELERELAELERTDPKVRAAREKLDRVTAEIVARGRAEGIRGPRVELLIDEASQFEAVAALLGYVARCRR